MPAKRVKFDGEALRLGDAVGEYVAFIGTTLKPSTVENKVLALRKMTRVVGGQSWTHEVSPQDISKVWNLATTTRNQNSLIVDHQAIKHFFIWCTTMGYWIGANPIGHIKAPKPVKRNHRYVAAEKFPALITSCVSPRDRLYVANGLYSLCRKVELYTWTWADIDRDAGEIMITRHKTGEDDVLAIGQEMEYELDYYEDWYRWITDTPKFQPLNPGWYVTPKFTRPFFTASGLVKGNIRPTELMGRQDGGLIVQKALKSIDFPLRNATTGLSTREGAHTLRRSGARAMYDALVAAEDVQALRKVQLQLGHKHQWQTLDYIGADPDKKARNDTLRGQVMYPQAQAAREELEESLAGRRSYGHLRSVG